MSIVKKESSKVKAYVTGFILSVASTLVAYWFVSEHLLSTNGLVVLIALLAVAQLVVQLVFFLHLGDEKGTRWKLVTFVFAVIVVGILVGGSLWIMNNLNYNMMRMTPAQQAQYMKDNEGI